MTRLPGPRTPIGDVIWGLRLLANPYPTLQRLQQRWGTVVAIGRGPVRYQFVFGPTANEAILSTHAGDLTWRETFASLIPVDGETALVVSDGDDHARRRRLVQPAFSLRRINGYTPIVVEEAERMVDSWQPGQHVDLHAEVKRAIRRIAIRALFGDALSEQADELGEHLQVAIDFANLPPLPGRDLDLPGSPFRKAMGARSRADAIVFAEIEQRHLTNNHGDDLLGSLLDAQDEDGSTLTDQEVRDQVVSLIAGGYETTAAVAAWGLYAAHRDPTIHGQLRTELADRPDGPYLGAVIQETLRLHGAAAVGGRTTHTAITVDGHTIPAGRRVIYSQYVTHRLDEHWPDPLRFDPRRWLDGNQLIEPAPYTFVPFGGGARRCIGFAMATLEAKTLLATVLRRADLMLERHDIDGAGLATYAPKGGVPVTITAVR